MGTLLIDKLLQTVVHPEGERPAPDRGQPADAPAAWSHAAAGDQGAGAGRHRGADEEHHARALPARACRRSGGRDFGFAFGEMARFRVAVFKQRGNIGLVLRRIPNEFLTFEQLGLPPVIERADQAPARLDPGDRPHRARARRPAWRR